MSNLTKREIVLEIYRKSGFPQKQIVDTVQQTLDIVQKALAGGRNVELRNFGVLEVQVRKQRIGRNPNKPEAEVVIPQRAVVKFKSGKILKQQLKKLDLGKLQATPPSAPPVTWRSRATSSSSAARRLVSAASSALSLHGSWQGVP